LPVQETVQGWKFGDGKRIDARVGIAEAHAVEEEEKDVAHIAVHDARTIAGIGETSNVRRQCR
jgi:hypothetical protein